jgi:[ribosomal protein S5]-alanine N-acetyltransferase
LEKLTINTPRLRIRNLRPADLGSFHAYRSNPEVVKFQSFDVITLERAKEIIASHTDKLFGKPGEWVQYGIENAATEQLVGDCAIKLDEDVRIAEVGITISHLEQKKGYAKEAFLRILSFLFDQQHVHRVVEIVDAENIASINLLKAAGFRQEGHFVENIFFKGKWGSEFQYAMLKREWERRK